MRGTLQVVATPIGNLADLSPRAQEALRGADVIAAEDTRRTLQLLQSIGISRPLVSLFEHNEAQRVPQLLERLSAGATVVLVSDAGTPLLSDPGFELVREATRAGFEVRAIPGPSAITTALAAAGLPADVLLRRLSAGNREARHRHSRARAAHLVFFEAPHRILAALTDYCRRVRANRRAVVRGSPRSQSFYRGTRAN
jgi:16S rRNA (cytidine1402-2'-O)-methyltransferase